MPREYDEENPFHSSEKILNEILSRHDPEGNSSETDFYTMNGIKH